MQHALKVLEFELIRQALAKHCETELGAYDAEAITPEFESEAALKLWTLTQEADGLLDRGGLPSLSAVKDERVALDRAQKGSALDGSTLFRIGQALAAMRAMHAYLAPKQEDCPTLWPIAQRLPLQNKLENLILSSVEPSGGVLSTASEELGRIRKQKSAQAAKIQAKAQSYLSGGVRELLSDPILTERAGRTVIPLRAEHRGKLKGIVHDTSASGQTLYIEPEELVQLGNQLREIEAAEKAEEERVLLALSRSVGDYAELISEGIVSASLLDFYLAKARLGAQMKAVLPEPLKHPAIMIQRGKHPLLDPESCVPLNLELGFEAQALLITGPNTGGKTVAIKTVGLFVLMAQCGLMLPAERVQLGPFSQVWADIGDEQSLAQSLSTFSGHIKNIAAALKGCQPGALVLLDEVGAGTDPAEGAALAAAILRAFRRAGGLILASTHYGELKIFASNEPGFLNCSMEFDQKTLKPTYRLLMGIPGASHALHIAGRYGVEPAVLEEARQGLGQTEQDISAMLQRLEFAQKQAQKAQSEADRLRSRLIEAEKSLEDKLALAEANRQSARANAAQELQEALRQIRLEADEVFEQLKKAPSQKAMEEARQRLRDLQDVGKELADEWQEPTQSAAKAQASKDIKWHKGMSVKVTGYSQIGVLLEEPRGDKVQVQLGALRMTVTLDQLLPHEQPPAAKKQVRRSAAPNLGLEKASSLPTELNLRHLRFGEAKELLEKYVDDAVLAGVPFVRVVHGKGGGVLREMTRRVLGQHPGVRSFRFADPSEGGQGVTVVYF